MRSFSVTDIGQKRKENEDFIFASEEKVGNLLNLFIVADGMGGHNAGDYASRLAVTTMLDSIRKDMGFNPIKILRSAIERANAEIYRQALEDPMKNGMGTTVVAVTIVGYYAYVANVGDSRLYLARTPNLVQITRDHSWIAEMVRRGELSREEARNHPDKNIITRAVGAQQTVEIDFFDVQMEKKDQILMCSDGLSNMLEESEIRAILDSTDDIALNAMRLVDRANENGGRDNISVILVEP